MADVTVIGSEGIAIALPKGRLFPTGSIELAPAMGLAERIVDLADSGRTLRENGLVEVEEILQSSARLIVNRASLKTRYGAIQTLIESLRSQKPARCGRTACG